MKKLLWTSAIALAVAACFTACDDSSSSGNSNEIPSYKAKADLPDTCELEVAKVDTSYYACLEDKWIEVKDSVVIEKIKNGIDEEELEKELKKLLRKKSSSSTKPESSSSVTEGDENEESSSSSEEAEEDEPSSSSKKKDKDDSGSGSSGGSGSGEGGSGEGGEGGESTPKRNAQFSVIDDYVTWSKDGKTATLKKDIDETSLKTIFEGFLVTIYGGSTSAAHKALDNVGSNIEAVDGDRIVMKTLKETKDSNSYILQIKALTKGSAIYTDISPLGQCGESMYPKRTKFCDNGVAYRLCDGKTYAPKEQFCDTRGTGTIYKYVTIGSGKKLQTWMAENLNYEYKVEGKTYGNVCYKDSDCKTYGRFYTYSAAMDSAKTKCGNLGCDVEGTVQGICPDGWHLPSIDEWNLLVESADEDAGLKLVAKSDGGSDEFGFGVRLAGEIYWYTTSGKKELKYHLNGEIGFFWSKDYIASAGQHDGWSQGEADAHYVYFSVDDEGYIGVTTDDGISISDMLNVRCVKNAE